MKKLLTLAVALCAVPLSVTTAYAAGNIQAGKTKAAMCASCHGMDGNGKEGADAASTFPKLAGQVPGYIAKQLTDFKDGKRTNAIMNGMAAGLSAEDIENLDAYYSSLTATPGAATDKKLALEGQKIFRGGYRPMNIPACMACHGPGGHGIPFSYPRVSGQYPEYTEAQLLAFKAGTRTNDPNKMMESIAFGLSADQIKALAQYMYGVH